LWLCPPSESPYGDAAAQVAALDSTHVGDAHAADQVGILPEGLLHATPARISRHVEHRGQRLAGTHCEHLLPDPYSRPLDGLRIEAGCQPDGLGKLIGVASAEAGAALLVNQGGDAEPGLPAKEILDGVHEGGAFARAQARGRTDAGDLARSPREVFARPLRGEAAFADQLGRPHTAELRDLLLQLHAREQIFHSGRVVETRVPVGSRLQLAHCGSPASERCLRT
jgi:hypothetical protein